MEQIEVYYREHRKKHISILRSILDGDEAAAEDVFHEAITRALKYHNTFLSSKGEFGGWFHRIVYNALSDYRKNKDGIVRSDTDPETVEGPNVNVIFEHFSTVDRVLEATPHELHREALKLHLFFGYTPKEVHEITGLTPNHVWQIVFNFRNRLKAEVGVDV